MKLRYAFVALFLAPTLASAQLPNQDTTLTPAGSPFYPELVVTAPAELAARITNFEPELLPVPPYTQPPATSLMLGSSVFLYSTAEGDSISLGTNHTPEGVTGQIVLALNDLGEPAFGCDGTAEMTSDIANGSELAGNIALIQRGPVATGTTACGFFLKAQRAEQNGAIGVIIYNNPERSPDNAPNMSGGTAADTPVGIPTASLSWTIAETFFNAYVNGTPATATLRLDQAYGVAGEGRPSPAGAGLFITGQNPTSTTARLEVRTPAAENVTVAAYNMLGQEVAVLYRGAVLGQQAVTLSATNLPSGTYFVRAVGETFSQTQQITIVR